MLLANPEFVSPVQEGTGMDLKCSKCGFTADYTEFRYLCRNG